MTQSTSSDAADPTATDSSVPPTTMTLWVGWIAFAGVMMVMLGTLHIIEGLVALFSKSYYLVGKNGLTVHASYTVWGWVQLIAGAVVLIAGFALFSGRAWARVVAVLVAMLSMIVNIGFLAAYPIWSTILVAVDIMVIWALMVHGREIQDD